MNKFNRTKFYVQQEVYGVLENDVADNFWYLFQIRRPYTFFTITPSYIQRPDLLSLKLYNTMNYWWVLGKYNQIDDWWNDIKVDDVIRVPDKLDIDDFYLSVRRERNKRGI